MNVLCLQGTCYLLHFLKRFPRITLGTQGGIQDPHVEPWASSPTASPGKTSLLQDALSESLQKQVRAAVLGQKGS